MKRWNFLILGNVGMYDFGKGKIPPEKKSVGRLGPGVFFFLVDVGIPMTMAIETGKKTQYFLGNARICTFAFVDFKSKSEVV